MCNGCVRARSARIPHLKKGVFERVFECLGIMIVSFGLDKEGAALKGTCAVFYK